MSQYLSSRSRFASAKYRRSAFVAVRVGVGVGVAVGVRTRVRVRVRAIRFGLGLGRRAGLSGRRRWNRWLRRRLARAKEAVVGRPVAGPRPGSAELPRAARRALSRRRSRAGALPRGHF
eukprot:scaffold40866_cov44-Phaeocystis_antarctica.AAC.2